MIDLVIVRSARMKMGVVTRVPTTAWIVATTLVSSLSNFLATAALLATQAPPQQKATSLVAVTTTLATLAVLRSAGTVVATRQGRVCGNYTPALAALTLIAVLLNAALAAVISGSGWWLGLVVVGASVYVQESLRILHIARGRPQRALEMDVVWMAFMVGAVIAILSGQELTPVTTIGLWALGAAVSSLVGVSRLRGYRLSFALMPQGGLVRSVCTGVIAGLPAVSALASTSVLNTVIPTWFGYGDFVSYRAAVTVLTPVALLAGAFPSILLGVLIGKRAGFDTSALLVRVTRMAALLVAITVTVPILVQVLPPEVWQAWLGDGAQVMLDLVPSVSVGVLGGALVSLPAASISAVGTVWMGSAMSATAQWAAVLGLAVPGIQGLGIVTANWISAASLWSCGCLALLMVLFFRGEALSGLRH